MTSIHDSDSGSDPDYVPEDVKGVINTSQLNLKVLTLQASIDSDSSDDEDNNHNADANAGTSPENVEEQKKFVFSSIFLKLEEFKRLVQRTRRFMGTVPSWGLVFGQKTGRGPTCANGQNREEISICW